MATTYLTGDMHGVVDGRFDARALARASVSPAADDVLVILGDTGILGRLDPEDVLGAWPGTVAFVDGNHEAHPTLAGLPTEERWGAPVGVVCGRLCHLLRGEAYELPCGDGTATCFVMGGAWSVDRDSRILGVSWFEEELPSDGELARGRETLDARGWAVDYVLTHECPASMRDELTQASEHDPGSHEDRLQDFLDEVDEDGDFDHWYCGHYHVDHDVGSCHTCLYKSVIPLGGYAEGRY